MLSSSFLLSSPFPPPRSPADGVAAVIDDVAPPSPLGLIDVEIDDADAEGGVVSTAALNRIFPNPVRLHSCRVNSKASLAMDNASVGHGFHNN